MTNNVVVNNHTILNKKTIILFINGVSNLLYYLNSIDKKKFFIIDHFVYNSYFLDRINKRFCFIIRNENYKNIGIVSKISDILLKEGFDKNSLIIAVGGGVVGDIAGFISSIYLRGIEYIAIPTTLLSQADSSIGGKNGVNNLFGKNIIGTFYFPSKIIISIDFLRTLDIYSFIDGLSEIIKICLVCNNLLFNYIYDLIFHKSLKYYDLKNILFSSIFSKVFIVSIDSFDNNVRMLLNLGHTIGHSIENYYSYLIPHGYSVFIGILVALFFSYIIGIIDVISLIKIIYFIFKFVCFYFINFLDFRIINIIHSFKYDKKRSGFTISFIFLKSIGISFLKSLSFNFLKSLFISGELVKRYN